MKSWSYYWLAGLVILIFLLTSSQLPGLPISMNRFHLDQSAISGRLEMQWGDGKPGSGALPLQKSSLVNDQGIRTPIQFTDPLPVPINQLMGLLGKKVTVYGSLSVNAASGQNQNIFQVNDIKPAGSEVVGQAITGSKPFVSILCKFSDISVTPETLSYFLGMYSSAFPGLDHYWREISYNKINIANSNAYDWYSMPHPRSYYVYDSNGDGKVEFDFGRATTDCTGQTAGVDLNQYYGLNLMFNSDLDGYSWGGNYNGKPTTWEPPWGYTDITVMSHEMGHAFGLPHSSYNPSQVYDNQWDVMSDTWSNCSSSYDATYHCLGQGTIGYHLDMEGWIPTANRIQVNPGYQTTLTLEQLDIPQTNNPLLVVIPIQGSTTFFYTVEARNNQTGYDRKLPGSAVIIHQVLTNRIQPAHVLDSNEAGTAGGMGARWLPGDIFHDDANKIVISVISQTTSGFVVTISNNALPPTSTPTATTTPTSIPTFTPTPAGYPIQGFLPLIFR
jgi:hypothetical protein